jgi:hypothetical protein
MDVGAAGRSLPRVIGRTAGALSAGRSGPTRRAAGGDPAVNQGIEEVIALFVLARLKWSNHTEIGTVE